MRNFLKITDGLPVGPIQQVLWTNPELWNKHRFRTTYHGTPHGDVDDIWLRFSPDHQPDQALAVMADTQPIWHTDSAPLWGCVKETVLAIMRMSDAWQLDRLLITRLAPGGRIAPHADVDGAYVNVPGLARFHAVIQGLPGSMFACGGEEVNMRTGELWWFNAHQQHSCWNNSIADRIHMLVDVRRWPC